MNCTNHLLKTTIRLTAILCLAANSLWAQNNTFKEVIPRTPNAGSLGKFGDIPVSHHTGVPNISIPLYTIQEGPLSLPVSLSYHSSGIKVDEVASWVGLGWSLNAGGMISRTVMGGPDEGITGTTSGGYSDKQRWGWYKDYGLLDKIVNPYLCDTYGNPNQHAITIAGQTYPCRSYALDAANGLIDTEPDIFTFNVSGSSGKFLFDENRTAYTIPWQDVHVKPTDDLFSGWTLITPDGTKYTFGGLTATEKNYTHNGQYGGIFHQYNTSTTWYLTKIESANGKHWISLAYETEDYTVVNRAGHSVTIKEENCIVPFSQSLTQAPTYLIQNNVKGVRLSQITTSSGTVVVDFLEDVAARQDLNAFQSNVNVNTLAKALKTVKIQGQTLCKEFVLNTGYFQSPSTGYSSALSDMKRLKLVSVQEKSCDGTLTLPPHQFFYNETSAMGRRLSLAKDYWGYYNGATGNTGLIPNGIMNPCNGMTLNGGANRAVNTTAMKLWVLEKIIYPTSGELLLEYGAHKYSGDTRTAGGIRIEKHTRKFFDGPDVVLNYEYFGSFLYTKDPSVLSSFFFEDPWINFQLVNFYSSGGAHTRDFGYSLNANPPSPIYSTQGFHIGYETIRETRSDGSYSRYFYNSTIIPTSSAKFPSIPAQNPIGSGQLQNQGIYTAGDIANQYAINNYATSPVEKVISPKKFTSLFDLDGTGPTNFVDTYAASTDYLLKTYRHRLEKKIEMQDGITTTTSYTYDGTNKHGNPIAISVTNSNGKTHVIEHIYPSDAGSGAPAAMYDPANTYFRNMRGLVIDSKEKVNGTLVSQNHNTYTFNSGANLLQLTSSRAYPTGTAEYVDAFYTYNNLDNIAMVQKQNDIKTAYIWGYNNGYPIAQVINADVKDVFYTGFEDTQGNSTDGDAKTGRKSRTNGLSKLLTNLTNGSYILSYWQKSGGNWVFNQQTVLVTGTSYTISLFNQIDDVRFYPATAQMTSYTYEPGVGILSVTDPNNQISTYSYDKLGRLTTIRDDDNNILKTYTYNYKN